MLVSFYDKKTQETIREYAKRLDEKGEEGMYNGMGQLYLIDRNNDGYRDDPDDNYFDVALELFIYISEIESINLMFKRFSAPEINLSSFYEVLKCLNQFSINSISHDTIVDFLKAYAQIKIETEKISHITKTGCSIDSKVLMFICGIMTCYSWPSGFMSDFEKIYYETFYDRDTSIDEFLVEIQELKEKYKSLSLVPDLVEKFK